MKRPRVILGGLPIIRATCSQLCDIMVEDVAAARAGKLTTPHFVTSANGSLIAEYHSSPELRRILDRADIIDADGMSLVFASKILTDNALEARAATTDFLVDAAKVAAREDIRFYFLGAKRGVASRAAEYMRNRYPGLQIVGVRHGYFADEQIPEICEAVRQSGADVLWIGLGTPRQEIFADKARELLGGVAWMRTCGGLFDHYGGGVSRAPALMQNMGLEWLYRAAREPVRLGWRYLTTNPRALYHLVTKTRSRPRPANLK